MTFFNEHNCLWPAPKNFLGAERWNNNSDGFDWDDGIILDLPFFKKT